MRIQKTVPNAPPSKRSAVRGRISAVLHKSGAFALVFLLAITLLLPLVLYAHSKGTVRPFTDENGEIMKNSISEKITVEINGAQQGMFIQGNDTGNPVLLFLHGGPGMPEYFLEVSSPTGLTKHFTVCWWEQRGAGTSFDNAADASTVTTDILVADTIAVTEYLCDRFGQQQVYLFGHSWGSYIGIQAAAKAPQLYSAYIGMGQITNPAKSESLAFDYMLDYYGSIGDSGMVKKLQAANPTGSQEELLAYMRSSLRDSAMHGAGIGTTRKMRSVFSGIFLPVMLCDSYTLGEKINIWRAKSKLVGESPLQTQLMSANLPQTLTKLEVPTYFFGGAFDYTTNTTLAKDYLNGIDAPIKGFYTFENSAHSPLFEEREKAVNILLNDVLSGAVNLAD